MPIDITAQERRAQYAISGTGPYDFDFEVLAQTDVAIYRDATLLTLTTDYTVVVNADGTGAVTLVSATGTTLTIIGARPYQRLTDYATGGDFTAEALNDEFDSQQIQIQQLDERIGRGLAVSSVSSYAGSFDFPAPGAGYYLRWNAAGDALEAVSAVNDAGSVTVGTISRSVTSMFSDRYSVLNDIPVALHAGIADGTGTTPLQTYIQTALTNHRCVYFPRGRYYTTGGVYSVWADEIDIEFEKGAYIDAVGTGYNAMWVGGVATSYDPTVYSGGKSITGNVTRESSSISISAPDIATLGLVAGSVIRITSSDLWYSGGTRSGEMARVLSISGTTVNLTRQLDDSYTAANTVVIRENCPVTTLKNIRIKRNTDASGDFGLVVNWVQNLLMEGCGSSGSRYTNAQVGFAYEFEIAGQWSWDSWEAVTGVNYGLMVVTSYHGHVHSSHLSGGRHALAIGGYEPVRHVTITGCSLGNRTSETAGAIDAHANSEFITVIGNHLYGGVNMAANNLKFSGNTVRGGINSRPLCIFYVWKNNGSLIIDGDNTFESIATSSGQAVIQISAMKDGLTSELIKVGGHLIGEVNFEQGALYIVPWGVAQGADWTITSLEVDIEATALTGSLAASAPVLIHDGARGDTYYPVIRQGVFRGRYFATGSDTGIHVLNLNTVNKNGDLLFTDMFVEASSRCINVDGARSLTVMPSVVLEGGGRVVAANISALAEVKAKIYDATSNKGINLAATVTESDTRGYYPNNCTGDISDSSTTQRALIKRSVNVNAKVGATAGWAVNAANNLGLLATLPAGQSGSTLVIPVPNLKAGDTIRSFHSVGQIESAGNTATYDVDLRKLTAAAADVTDASVATMTQLSVIADTAITVSNSNKASLTEVVGADETFYFLITATTAADTDIALQGLYVVVTEA